MLEAITIYIIEDEKSYAESVCSQLGILSKNRIKCLGFGDDVEEAVQEILKVNPSVILIDLILKNKRTNGFHVANKLRQHHFTGKFIALTKEDRPYQPVSKALKLGFTGYILKSKSLLEIIYAIEDVYNGKLAIDPLLTSFLTGDNIYESIISLGRRHKEVLRLAKEGNSNREIGERLGVAENTVKKYVGEINNYLGFSNRAQLTAFTTQLELTGLLSLLLDDEE